jgi:hypothetical protein
MNRLVELLMLLIGYSIARLVVVSRMHSDLYLGVRWYIYRAQVVCMDSVQQYSPHPGGKQNIYHRFWQE